MAIEEREKRYSIVCFGCVWDDFWRRRQQIMYHLSKRNEIEKVIYVEFPLTLISLIKYFFGKADEDGMRRWKRVFDYGLTYNLDNVMVIFPLAMFPFLPWKLIRKINNFITFSLLFIRIKDIILKLGLKNIITWIDHPSYPSSFFGKLKESVYCYDVADEHWKFNEAHMKGRIEELTRNDVDNTKKADIVFTNSAKLFHGKKRINPHTYLLTNGVDFELFQKMLKTNFSVPDDLKIIKKPIIGFIAGILDEKHDIDLVLRIAIDRPFWSLVIIGPKHFDLQGKIGELVNLKNVHILGPKPYSQLPIYIQHFDVCVNFYKVNEINDSCTSIKLLNYLAVGKPVVSTNTAGAQLFSEVVNIATDEQDFVSLIEKSILNDSTIESEKKKNIAKQNLWESKVLEICNIFNAHF